MWKQWLDMHYWFDLPLMGCRVMQLQDAIAAHERGAPLLTRYGQPFNIGESGGTFPAAPGFYPAAEGDDLGLSLFGTLAAALLGSDAATAARAVLWSVVAAGLLVGMTSGMLLLRTTAARLYLCMAVLESLALCRRAGDMYVISCACAWAVLPTIMLIARRESQGVLSSFAIMALGAVIALANLFRSHAGTTVAITAVLLVLLSTHMTGRLKAKATMLLAVGYLLVQILLMAQLSKRDSFLASNGPADYKQRTLQHVMWHSIYIGFGFLGDAPDGITYRDECAGAAVRAVDPDAAYCSARYEEILRGKVMQLVREHCGFVIRTIAAKLRTLAYFIVVFAHLGVLCAVLSPPPWREALPFASGMAFGALPGLLVMPLPGYVSGMLALSVIGGACAVEGAATHYLSEGFRLRGRSRA